ncbi:MULTISPECIES: helix-turn-helix domain-containing protein [Mesorhizobium]|uniref:helix-turn-helix domain-containing protein n=1 Tax=Mesorhizobium TaxID=68287 RepID=UPI001459FD84|nr:MULTISPECIES: helix-turn-helix transcriptional regulator [Mesorhizobium]
MTSEEFKAWRNSLGISQTEAATTLGVSRGSIENYERGQSGEKRTVPIPRTVELACYAILAQIDAVLGPPIGSLLDQWFARVKGELTALIATTNKKPA